MEDGTVYRGKMFIDATYEGDLMAKAGVKYMVGREANARFDETLNGIRDKTPHHQFVVPVDPYVKPGDREAGLLPFISAEPLGTPGAGDASVQAYNFRLCLTKKPENQLPDRATARLRREAIRAVRPLLRSAEGGGQKGDAADVPEDRHGDAGEDGH